MSNAKTQTFTLTSSALTSFLFRVISCWKGNTFLCTRSQATVSQSRTKLFVLGLIQVFNFSKMSGYFLERSSEFREKTEARPLNALESFCNVVFAAGNSFMVSGAT